MPQIHIRLGIVVARRTLRGQWADHEWAPSSALPDAPAVAKMTPLGGDVSGALFYGGEATLTLHSGETAHYRDNLQSGEPALWVALRRLEDEKIEVASVTADPYEGEALAESGDIVGVVAMPQIVIDQVAAFFSAHHVEREFFKRQRNKTQPDIFNRRPGGLSERSDG